MNNIDSKNTKQDNNEETDEGLVDKGSEEEQVVDEAVLQLQEQVEDFKNKYARAIADYQNLERRVQEQKRELIISANKELLLRILPILDTLQLATQHSQDKALQASIQQFVGILTSEGVTAIETLGKEFDPSIMECVTTAAGKDNIVITQIRAGYMLNDKLLRTAQVVVGNGEENKN